jgi:D-alanyl-lipoteichoic acid acyltransferase DltB (MBOAT superfamily)
VLFNTFTYAKFLAIVFVCAWVLVSRRWALLAPWIALAAYVSLASSSALDLVLVVAALGPTLLVCRRARDGDVPALGLASAAVAVNLVALAFVTFRHEAADPVSAALHALRLPIGSGPVWSACGLLAGALGAVALLRARKMRLAFILAASYVFYAHWDWRFLPLIWASSTADWLLGNAIARAGTPRVKKLWLLGTVLMNLGVLAIFKYFDFGIASLRSVLEVAGFHLPDIALRVALPVGISFFTFESMSYVIDIYRGVIQPQKSYLEYLSFVAFFPHLVAGPIVRPRDLLPQLAGAPRFNAREGSEALWLIAIGLLKKMAIGDYLALNLVDRVFDAPQMYSSLECYAATIGYALQIYCDFSGYTDIAIGSALLLGVRFPLNFDAPYKAQNIAEFWRRWHISLSSWLRDYLYIPLGGNRKGPRRTYLNLMLTMLLGGLWHGASWTFVVWGGLHGAALAVTRFWHERWAGFTQARRGAIWTRVLAVLATFHFVCACWIFFRAESFRQAYLFFSQLGQLSTHHRNLPPEILAVLGVGLVTHYAPEHWYRTGREAFVRLPALAQGFALFGAGMALRQMASAQAVPFVYFQF